MYIIYYCVMGQPFFDESVYDFCPAEWSQLYPSTCESVFMIPGTVSLEE